MSHDFRVVPTELKQIAADITVYADTIDRAIHFLGDHGWRALVDIPLDPRKYREVYEAISKLNGDYEIMRERWLVALKILSHAIRSLGERAKGAAEEYQGSDERVAKQWLDRVTGND